MFGDGPAERLKETRENEMLLGFNMLLWSTHVTEEHFSRFTDIKRAGFDGVELPIFEGSPSISKRWARRSAITACGRPR